MQAVHGQVAAWVAWWKRYLTAKYGADYASRFGSYFERVYMPCAPDQAVCTTTPRSLSEWLRYYAAGCHRLT